MRGLRDHLLVSGPEARKIGEAFVTRVLLLATVHTRLPPDRLLVTEDAARLIGVDTETLDQLCYTAQIKPKYSLKRHNYWSVKDIYSLVDK